MTPRPAGVGPDEGDGLLTQWGRVKGVRMLAPFPAPSNPEVWLPFLLGTAAEVDVTIYDVRGNRVRTLGMGMLQPGAYVSRRRAAHWNGRNSSGELVASGRYVAEIAAGPAARSRRQLLVLK